MPSRQERRKAERDAAKRAPAQAGAAGAAGAAAALANLRVNLDGNWTTQAEDPSVGPRGDCLARHVVGCHKLKRRRVQSAVYDVAIDVYLARPLGAVSCARSRDREAEG